MGKGRPRTKLAGSALPLPIEHRWTVQQIATAHQMSARTVVQCIERGELAAEKLAKEWRVSDSDYRRWIAAGRVSFSPRAEQGGLAHA